MGEPHQSLEPITARHVEQPCRKNRGITLMLGKGAGCIVICSRWPYWIISSMQVGLRRRVTVTMALFNILLLGRLVGGWRREPASL